MGCQHNPHSVSLDEWREVTLARAQEEISIVSIQIRDMANPDAQAEVRGRIRGLISAAKETEHEDAHPNASGGSTGEKLREEVIAMHIALTGYAPTREQLAECGIE